MEPRRSRLRHAPGTRGEPDAGGGPDARGDLDARKLLTPPWTRIAGAARRGFSSLMPEPGWLEVLHEPAFNAALTTYAADNGISPDEVREQASAYLAEMFASHGERVTQSWTHFAQWMLRAHDVVVDEDNLVAVRRLDRSATLGFVFSHRSYLDGFVLPLVLATRRFSPTYTFGGANLDLPLFGQAAGLTGLIFVRRATQSLPLYRLVLRSYIAHLARNRSNLAWAIEGGRTRTGKLRPPVHGILRYLADAADAGGSGGSGERGSPAHSSSGHGGPEFLLVPVSIVYDQLHEVALMATEARGTVKRPENWAWLLSLAWSQGSRLGRAYVTFGEPIPLRQRMAELRAQGVAEGQVVRRVALDASHRINQATPVTVTAVVCLALLGADRALTFDEVLTTVSPFAGYIEARQWSVAGGATLTDRSTIRRALQELVASGVLHCHDTGTEAVWRVGDQQHLIAAFYRNTVIHILVERGIAELSLLDAVEKPGQDAAAAFWQSALALRDLLKFEFFFPARRGYVQDLHAELAILSPDASPTLSRSRARAMLEGAPMSMANLVLRPFVDAYLVLADRLAACGEAELTVAGEKDLLTESLHLGEQWVLQRRIANAESVSLELLRTALTLAGHRKLLRDTVALDGSDLSGASGGHEALVGGESADATDATDTHAINVGALDGDDVPDAAGRGLGLRRAEFLAEIVDVHRRLTTLADLASGVTLPESTP